MSAKGTLGFILGSIVGAVAGATAGLLLAPRTGAESRAMAADAMNDAWDSAVDAYERGSRVVSDKISNVRPSVDATTDELRAKVDLARERMDQLRSSLSDADPHLQALSLTCINSLLQMDFLNMHIPLQVCSVAMECSSSLYLFFRRHLLSCYHLLYLVTLTFPICVLTSIIQQL